MASLYELTGNYQTLYDMAEEFEENPELWEDTMEAIDGEIEEKAENYAKLIKILEADNEAYKAEEERCYKHRKANENLITRLKANLQDAMEITGKTKFKSGLFSFNVQNNAPSVFIADETRVPLQFQIPQPNKIDKTKLKDWLKAGNECDFASLVTGRSLRIR